MEAFPIEEFESKLFEFLDGAEILYYRLGVDRDLDEKIIKEIGRMRALNRKPIHPPHTIIDPATIVHEMRVVKSPDELEIMQAAADIAAEAHVEAMKAVRPGMQEYRDRSLDRAGLQATWLCWSGLHVDRRWWSKRNRAALHKQRRRTSRWRFVVA